MKILNDVALVIFFFQFCGFEIFVNFFIFKAKLAKFALFVFKLLKILGGKNTTLPKTLPCMQLELIQIEFK
jgi:hypothetical protein